MRPRLLRAAVAALRHHLVVVAVSAAGLLLAVSAAAAPVFASSARSGSLHEQLAGYCPWDQQRAIGVHLPGPVTGEFPIDYAVLTPGSGAGVHDVELKRPAEQVRRQQLALLHRRLAAVPHLGESKVSVSGSLVVPAFRGEPARQLGAVQQTRLIYRDGAGAHVQLLERRPGAGVWLSDVTARELGVHAGEDITLRLGRAVVPVRVAAVYRDLAALPRADFWCSLADEIYPVNIFADMPPRPVIVPTRAQLRDLSMRLGSPADFDVFFEQQLRLPLTVAEAARTATAAGAALAPFTTFPPPPAVGSLGGFEVRPFTLDLEVELARAVGAGITTPVSAIAAAGSAVGLLLVAAVGGLWVDRRRREVMLLTSKGVRASAVGLQAVAETLLPFLAGTGIGYLIGVTVVARLGPGPVLEAGTTTAAAVRTLVVAAVGVLVLGLTATWLTRRAGETPVGRRRRWVSRTPWELAVVSAAGALFVASGGHGLDLSHSSVPTLRPSQLAFVLIALTGGVLLGVRVIAGGIALTRTRGHSWPNAGYLAARRLAASLRVTVLFVVTVAVPIGVLVAAHVLVSTLQYTTDAKALLFIGSHNVFDIRNAHSAPPAQLRGRATVVDRIDGATVAGQDVQVLAIDPATFAGAAFWDSRFARAPLPTLLDRITTRGSPPTAVPALVIGATAADGSTLHLPGTSSAGAEHGTDIPINVVGRPQWFPGERGSAVVVVDRTAIPASRVHATTELWVAGATASAESAIASAGWTVRYTVTLAQVSRAPDLIVITWTFGFLQGVAILIAAIAVGGLLLYLNARQRRSQLAYAFARRMGLTRAGHLRSVLIETGGMLAAALCIGAGAATAAAYVVHSRLDPQPFTPPDPLFTIAPAIYGWVAAVCAAVALLAAAIVQIGADRSNKAELLRLT